MGKDKMNVLIACEESQEVCKAFRERGHEAYSCDLLPCSGGHPEWHIQDDVKNIISGNWDLRIGFPPCDHLAVSGARWFAVKKLDGRQKQGIDFFLFLSEWCNAIENPVGIMSTIYRKPDQIINPFDFGDPAQKPTCLWLKNLPKLRATNLGDAPLFGERLDKGEFHKTSGGNVLPKWYNLPPSKDRAKIRSRTFPGIAKAMAEQWG